MTNDAEAWPRDARITPVTHEEQQEVLTPNGIRRRLNRLRYHNAMLSNAYYSSFHYGMSGEDYYTVLAFEALKKVEKLERILMERETLSTHPAILSE